jgi:hypothetical protein
VGFQNLWKRFKEGDSAFRDKHLKYVATLKNAPWLLEKFIDSLGGQRPVILGKGYLKQHHFTGPNYVEVDIDVTSDPIAKQISSSILGYTQYLQVLETFVVEGQQEDELPERALVAFACINVTMDKNVAFMRPEDWVEDGASSPIARKTGAVPVKKRASMLWWLIALVVVLLALAAQRAGLRISITMAT